MLILWTACFYLLLSHDFGQFWLVCGTPCWGCVINPLSANLTKWPNTLKQFVGNYMSTKESKKILCVKVAYLYQVGQYFYNFCFSVLFSKFFFFFTCCFLNICPRNTSQIELNILSILLPTFSFGVKRRSHFLCSKWQLVRYKNRWILLNSNLVPEQKIALEMRLT